MWTFFKWKNKLLINSDIKNSARKKLGIKPSGQKELVTQAHLYVISDRMNYGYV